MTLPIGQHCIFCKSTYHNYRNCPQAFRAKTVGLQNANAKKDYFGQSPNVFVGRYGYPRVNVGFLNVEEYTEQDEPLKWSKDGTPIAKIIDHRSSMINSNFQHHIKSFNDRLIEMGREIGMAKKPADMEISLNKKPSFKTSFDGYAQPHGPNVKLETARITDNVKVDTRVERVVDDTDLKSAPALQSLYKKGFDEHFLTKLLSVGNLGIKTQRKMVPTRWSITATDDTLGKSIIDDVKKLSQGGLCVHTGNYLGNYYILLFYDTLWSYELFEGFVPALLKNGVASWEHDAESYNGRKEYAKETAGGYYAARLAILEGLKERKRQHAVLAFRFVTEEYSAPLGVWVVREAVRKTMESKPLGFTDRDLMEQYAIAYCKKKFGFDITLTLKQSVLKKEQQAQMSLGKWV